VRGEARRILEHSKSALITDPEDVDGIAAAIARLRDDDVLRAQLGRAGRGFALAEYDRRILADRYVHTLMDACASH
jgi:colanic acid biosynthesis glycosyl transferase WcaI